ncbi:DEAD/DEAH box helicase [Chryseobacterium cucumeris]
MSSLTIVRGDLTSKPVAASRLADFFEQHKDDFDGVLYIGYPIIGTNRGSYQIDCLMVLKHHGLITINLLEGDNEDVNELFRDIQDENYDKLNAKLFLDSNLTHRRKLGFNINTVTYAPRASADIVDEDYHLFKDLENFKNYIAGLTWDEKFFTPLLSAVQSITSIRNSKSREYVIHEDSRGGKLKKLEDSIANLDRQQSRAVIETVEGVQRIRGLAGSGKTIILALKVAYLHVKNPNWKIAVTFNTRSLKEQFRKLINMFVIEHSSSEPDWTKIDIIHAWGNSREEGIYYNLCKEHNINYLDLNDTKAKNVIYGREFDFVCSTALADISIFKQKYDLIVIDEAQDFSKDFLVICYNILKTPKRLVYAYDELQSLSKKSMPAPEEIFGNDNAGNPLVRLINEPGKPLQDIILYKCYRNSREILTSAHALGFGIYKKGGLVQMFENSKLWEDVGYKVEEGMLSDGHEVTLIRNDESSPEFLSQHSHEDDLIIFKEFDNNDEQVNYVVAEIIKNIKEEELRLDDIIVINPDPLTTKRVVGEFRTKLFQEGINSSLAGVSSSPDIFYEEGAITFTGIYRAKGNEAAMVYVINAQDCYKGYELAKKRNILFTAMTRSKAWLRVCGYGRDMNKLVEEFNTVKDLGFRLKFDYPTEEERENMNIVNRDMTLDERKLIQAKEKSLSELAESLKSGKIYLQDLDANLLDELKRLLNE